MRPWRAISLFGLSFLSPGCALIEDANRNLCVAVSTPVETHRENARNRRWAEAAWQNACGTEAVGTRSTDYARGFKDGYTEYLFRGGDGEPPLVAPLHYRNISYQTARGYAAIEDWFAGYRHGAAVARDTGARRWITGPSGLPAELHGASAHDPHEVLPGRHPDDIGEPMFLPPPRLTPMKTTEKSPPKSAPIRLEAPSSSSAQVAPKSTAKISPSEPPGAKATNIDKSREAGLGTLLPPEPVRVRIVSVSELTQPPGEPTKTNSTGINVSPQPRPEISPQPRPEISPQPRPETMSFPPPAPEPIRAKLVTITVPPPKD